MNESDIDFGNDLLLSSLGRLPAPRKYWIGFSGGADSTALLQAMCECRDHLAAPVAAVHFHHGLQPEADAWQDHCRAFCRDRQLPFTATKLEVDPSGRCSTEEAARNSRYDAVAAMLGPQEMYLTGHQAEDQAETLFLNLMRGSGVEGLAGIPELRSLGSGWVARPLLTVRRRDLEAYLAQRDIRWLTDPSNEDTAFDRNYLRQDLFPRLEQRWPGLIRRLSRTARNARITAAAMATFIESQCGNLIGDPLKMPLTELLRLEPEMQSLILRQWLRRHEAPVLPEQRLLELLAQLAAGRPDTQPEARWAGWLVKRYRSDLWLHREESCAPCPARPWRDAMQLDLGRLSGKLRLRGPARHIPSGWQARARRPGDRIRPHRDAASRELKDLFQRAAIPPWLRSAVPVLEWDGEAVALGDWFVGHRLHEWLLANRLTYHWEALDPVLLRLRSDCQPESVDRRPSVG